MSLVYIGCGSDFEPVIRLPEVKKFIYIDSQPRSEYGWLEYGTRFFLRKNYMCEFRKGLPNQFMKINIDNTYPDVYHDCLNDRTIFHYYDLPFPWTSKILLYHVTKKDIELLKFEISQATHLAICGHDPHADILEMLSPKFILVTNDNTCYPRNEKEVEEGYDGFPTVWSELIFSKTNQKRITEIKYLNKEEVKTFKNLTEFLIKKNIYNLFSNSSTFFIKY